LKTHKHMTSDRSVGLWTSCRKWRLSARPAYRNRYLQS